MPGMLTLLLSGPRLEGQGLKEQEPGLDRLSPMILTARE